MPSDNFDIIVALRKESVDRNNAKIVVKTCVLYVALRKESVDRNVHGFFDFPSSHNVALRKESVDRNTEFDIKKPINKKSLSARRAWIEIDSFKILSCKSLVALRKESVDRNVLLLVHLFMQLRVALRKESVDRNFKVVKCVKNFTGSLSARRAWIEIQVSS